MRHLLSPAMRSLQDALDSATQLELIEEEHARKHLLLSRLDDALDQLNVQEDKISLSALLRADKMLIEARKQIETSNHVAGEDLLVRVEALLGNIK